MCPHYSNKRHFTLSIETEIENCITILRKGGTILYPTDTVWGIGCDATNEKAVEEVFRIKRRTESKSLIILVADEKMLNRHVKEVPGIAWDLIELSDKPLTIIYEEGIELAKNVIAGDGSIAIRIPKDEFCKKMIYKFGRPVVSTSANISGENVPRNFGEINPLIKQSVSYIAGLRQNETSGAKVSSIIKVGPGGEFEIIRK